LASGQEPGELGLARGALPALGYHGGGDGRYDAAEQQGARWRARIRRSPCPAAVSAPES
jgi:hypothetical protein